MPQKESVLTDKAPAPLPFFSQAIKCQGMVYCSGSLGIDPVTKKMVEGGVGDRARQALANLAAVLEAAGSSIDNCVQVKVFLTNMENFAAVNKVYAEVFNKDPAPVRTCVAVYQLPMGSDVEIECIAHQGEDFVLVDHESEDVKSEETKSEKVEFKEEQPAPVVVSNLLMRDW